MFLSFTLLSRQAMKRSYLEREREGYGSICSFLSQEENNWKGMSDFYCLIFHICLIKFWNLLYS